MREQQRLQQLWHVHSTCSRTQGHHGISHAHPLTPRCGELRFSFGPRCRLLQIPQQSYQTLHRGGRTQARGIIYALSSYAPLVSPVPPTRHPVRGIATTVGFHGCRRAMNATNIGGTPARSLNEDLRYISANDHTYIRLTAWHVAITNLIKLP